MRRRVIVSVVCAAGLLMSACGGDGSGSSDDASISTFDIEQELTTINGSVPEGKPWPLQDVTTMLDTVDADGKRLVITRGVRKAGTRVGIHVHKYGGHTCVMSGVITDFVEGHESMVWPAGTCYYMPPNVPMAAANLGTEDAVLVDTFNLPPGEPTITILEPGWPPD